MGAKEQELVPLHAGFDVVYRGFHRRQVIEHMENLEEQLRFTSLDRAEALAQAADLRKLLEMARHDLEEARARIERLETTSGSHASATERMHRMLRLAEDETAEMHLQTERECADLRARTEVELAELRAEAEREAAAMRAEAESELYAVRQDCASAPRPWNGARSRWNAGAPTSKPSTASAPTRWSASARRRSPRSRPTRTGCCGRPRCSATRWRPTRTQAREGPALLRAHHVPPPQ